MLRNLREVLVDQLLRDAWIEVASQNHRRVVGPVVRLVELADVGDACRFEVFDAANHRKAVRMGRERLVVDDLGQTAIGLVVHPLPPLLLHHFPFHPERLCCGTVSQNTVVSSVV
jgi:hypothetical protein